MALLPKELSRSNKWSWMLELPPDNVTPLVHKHGQVSVRSDPFGKGWIHDCLRGGSDSNWLLQIALSTLGYPGDLSSEPFHMLFLFAERLFCDKHWEVAILHAIILEPLVHEALNLLPDKVRNRSQNITPRNVVVLNHVRLSNHLLIPFGEVLFFGILDAFLVSSCLGLVSLLLHLLLLALFLSLFLLWLLIWFLFWFLLWLISTLSTSWFNSLSSA